jgi:hypothetical protein
VRLTFDFLDAWSKLGERAILRPHSNEALPPYDYLLKKYGAHLVLDNQLGFFMFLQQVSAVLALNTTAITEAYLARTPIICLEELLHGRYQDHLNSPDARLEYLDYVWRPETLDELIQLAQQAQRGQLPICPKPAAFEAVLRDYYDWPRTESTCVTVARDMIQTLTQEPVEPERLSELERLIRDTRFYAYILAREVYNGFSTTHRKYDRMQNHLFITRGEEQALMQFMRPISTIDTGAREAH